jgi:uncharacterized protein YfaS (alpha-2-macroglobulin family)
MLQYEALLGIQGDLLEAAQSGVPARMLPVGVVNLPTYGLSATALRDAEALRWLARDDRGTGPAGAGWRWDWISPGMPENVRAVRPIDLDRLLSGTPGAHAALVGLAVPGQADRPDTAYVGVTDLGVTARLSRYGSLVWVTRLSNGAPVSGAQVALRTAKREVFSTTTDTQGLAQIPASAASPIAVSGTVDPAQWIFARSGDDWVLQSLARSTAHERAAPDVDLQQRGEWEGLVFTDRGVYRPGETVRLSAIVRKSDAAGLKVPNASDARVEVKDAEDQRIFSGHATTDAFGELAMEVPLPHTSHLGSAVVSVRVGGERQAFQTNILLAAYKASEFEVHVDAARPEYVRGEVAEFSARGTYLYGAPMAGASTHDAASRTTTSFSPPGSEGFTTTDDIFTSDYADTSPRTSELHVDDGDLDEGGRLTRSLPLDMPGQRGPEIVTFEAQVEDLTRQTVAQSASILVHPAPFYLGLRRPPARFVSIGAVLRPDVVAFEPGGAHRAGVHARVELVSRVWADVAVDEAAAVPRHVTRPVDTVVASCDVTTTAAAASCPLRVAAPGYYVLRATSAGPVVRASTFLYALDDRSDRPPSLGWSDSGGRGLRLEADKDTYAAGETAKILVGNPFKEADALVTVERAGVLWQEVVHVKGPLPVVTVPIAHEYYPNVFVGVHLVRGRVAAAPAPGLADLGGPDFRTGYKELSIDPGTHRLAVEVRGPRGDLHPGDEVDADVHVTGADGRGVRSAVTFYAVDEGVLMLTGYKTPDPLPAFAEHKRLADFGVESRERLAHFVVMKNGERVPILGFEAREAPEAEAKASMADKGENGGGGDAPLRADFRTTVAFEAGRVTSGEGAATFHFRLPDNLTRFRLMAVVASADDRFGFGESTITSSRKLMARPAMPRVVRVGDAFDASVVVSSKDPAAPGPGPITVDLDARGVNLAGPRSRSVALSARGQAEVRFPVRATGAGKAQFVFTVRGGAGLGDRVLVDRTVDLPVDPRVAAVYGEMTGDTAIALGDLQSVRPDRGALHVQLATTALVGIDSAFDQLSEYPYGCTEQLTSRALPLLSLDGLARAFHARIPSGSHDALDDAVGALLAHQHGSGGFGYWNDDPEVPWLSAYALWALETASKKGYFVPSDALDRGIAYLRTQLNKGRRRHSQGDGDGDGDDPNGDESSGSSDDESAEAPARAAVTSPDDAGFTEAFIADVLAEVGAPDPGALDRAFETRDSLSLSGQALLLHAMAAAHLRGTELAMLAKGIEQRLRVGPNEAVADAAGNDMDLDSSARTTALVLRALLAVDPKHPLAARLARGLLGLRSGGAWRSTQENLWALVALEEYRQAQESRTLTADVEAFLGTDLVSRSAFRSASDVDAPIDVPMDRLVKSGARALSFAVKGGGKVFYAAELDYAATELPTRPDDSGFFVQRLVRAVKPGGLAAALKELPKTSVSRAEAGDLVLVDLLVESAEPREQVVIEDPLPSGVEAIDFDLETSSKLEATSDFATERLRDQGPGAPGTQLGYGAAFAVAENVHREVHDDRVLTFARHIDPGMYHFRYLARATTPGHFVVPPAEMRCMYSPEVTGRTATSSFDVVMPAGPKVAEAQP